LKNCKNRPANLAGLEFEIQTSRTRGTSVNLSTIEAVIAKGN